MSNNDQYKMPKGTAENGAPTEPTIEKTRLDLFYADHGNKLHNLTFEDVDKDIINNLYEYSLSDLELCLQVAKNKAQFYSQHIARLQMLTRLTEAEIKERERYIDKVIGYSKSLAVLSVVMDAKMEGILAKASDGYKMGG